MWRLFIFLVILIASVWVGIEIATHPGYLFITYQPWMVQMPLWFAFLSILIAFGIFYFFIHLVDCTQFLWFKFKNWLRFRRTRQSFSKTQYGLALLIEGRWKKAEKLLLAGAEQTPEPLMNYLGLAKAAQELKAYARRDSYIQKAYEIAPHAELAIGITRAELELEQNQLEQAAATLTHLKQISPLHPRVLLLLEKVYVRLGDLKHLQDLLPAMRKAKLLTPEYAALFAKNLYCEQLRASTILTLDDAEHIWATIPRDMRKNPEVVHEYVKQLLRFSATKEAEELIRKTLKTHWSAPLVNIYGTLPFSNLNRQLVIVGAWVKLYGQQPELLLLLGKLCVRIQLWGKAKDYFERCLAQGPNAEATLAYGKLLEHLDETDKAMEVYTSGLEGLVAKEAI